MDSSRPEADAAVVPDKEGKGGSIGRAAQQPSHPAMAGSIERSPAKLAVGGSSRTKRPSTNIRPNVGRRDMKEYPLTESDIETLGLTKGGATFFFSAASALLGFVGNQIKLFSWEGVTTSLAQPVPAFALGAAAICFLVGVYLWIANGSAIRRIKREVRFEE